jgi:type II secretory pathway component GspD/PulD (secretin)
MFRTAVLALPLILVAAAARAQPGPDPAGPGRADAAAATPRPAAPGRAPIVSKLANLRVTLEFNDTPLEDVIEFVRQFTQLNILIDASVTEKHGKNGVKITMKVKDLPLGSAFKLMLETQGLTMVYRDRVLLVVTEDRANQTLVMQVYDVRDLMMKVNDFPGPEISLEPLRGTTSTQPDEGPPQLTDTFVLEAVKTNCGKGTWDANPKVSIEMHNGLLIVTQTTDVHKQIKSLLNKLRAAK